ncbi:hypothetical protein FRC07_000257 [Ceratobasidium sp. 392]|nr:hypothetical protein FRC07_000257 [Ceratobasidium sp. 392]
MNDRPRRKSASYRTITTNREKKAMEEEEQADEKRSGKAKSETRMLIEEEKDKTTAGNAYIIVIPDPTPEDARGIRRVDSKGLPGKYYFWIKIGDSRNAENRVTDYCDSDSKHVVMHVTGKLHPGKQLELECLKDHAKGGLLQGSQTEWHQLCAQDRDHAGRIRGQLMTLLNGVDNKTLTYSKALIRIQNALANTTDPLFNSEPAADAVVNKWITLLIYPRIDLGRINCGVERVRDVILFF